MRYRTLFLLLLPMLLIAFQSFGQSGVTFNNYYVTGALSVGNGNKFPDVSQWLSVGPDTSTRGIGLPKVMLSSFSTTKRGVFVYNLTDSNIYVVDGTNKLRYLNLKDTVLIKQLIEESGTSGGTVTSIDVQPGSSGTQPNSSGGPVTTSGVITFNIPNASAVGVTRGLLSRAAYDSLVAAYDNIVTSMVVTGGLTKTIQLTKSNGSTLSSSFPIDSAGHAKKSDTTWYAQIAQRADTAIYAQVDSVSYADTSGYAIKADSALYGKYAQLSDTAIYAQNIAPIDSVLYADSAGYAVKADSALYGKYAEKSDTAIYAQNVTPIDSVLYADSALHARYADSALFSQNAGLLESQNGAYYRNRANHTGTQLASTISDFTTAARSAAVQDAINNGVTDIAASQNAIYDALLLKLNISDTASMLGPYMNFGDTAGIIATQYDISGFIPYTDTLDRTITTRYFVDSLFGTAGGTGTVTSVDLSTPSWLSVSGSPITSSGTLAVTAATGQTANQFLATPNGVTGAVGLRSIVAADIPTLNQNTTGSAATLTTSRNFWGQPFNGSADVSGTITLGTGNITMTGSIGATGARVTKGWFTDIESTNVPTVGGTALPVKADNLSVFAATTSAQLAGVISNETGSGLLVFGTSPTLTTPVISSIVNTGTLSLPTVTSTITSYKESSDVSTATPTPAGDARQIKYYLTALATAPTFAVPSGTPANGNELLIRIKDNGTARALAWNPIYRGGTLIALPSTTTISKTMYVQFVYNSADSKWDLIGLTDGLYIPFWLLLAFTRMRIRIRNIFRLKFVLPIICIFALLSPVQAQVICNGWRYAVAPSFPSANRWGRWVATTGITHSSNRVSAWAEYYGNGKTFSEATSTKQPLWNGTDAITFTGVSPRIEDLACSSALTASYTIYVIMQETISINGDAGFQISDNGTMYMYSVREAGVNKYRVYGNAFANSITSTANITAGTYYFLKAKVNGASSSIKLNTTQTTGNLGSLNISTPLILGYVGNASSNFTIKDFAIFTGVHDEAGVETAYHDLYGVP